MSVTFLLFEILCKKVKILYQYQDFLRDRGNKVFGQSYKNLFEHSYILLLISIFNRF